jgi:serine/threonine protein phosphatase PrpC
MAKLFSASFSELGSRTENQDAILSDDDLAIYLIADGMGGHSNGAQASQLAISTASNLASEMLRHGNVSLPNIREILHSVNSTLWEQNKSKSLSARMGTTLSIAIINPAFLAIGHVGDTRIYLIDDGAFPLTVDHVVQSTRAPAVSSHILSQALGISSDINPQVTYSELSGPYQLILCSDGVYRNLTAEELWKVCCSTDDTVLRAAKARDLLRARNPDDNFSAIFVQKD